MKVVSRHLAVFVTVVFPCVRIFVVLLTAPLSLVFQFCSRFVGPFPEIAVAFLTVSLRRLVQEVVRAQSPLVQYCTVF